MKLFKNLLLVSVLILGFTATQAQSKLGHINIQELVSAMPQTKQMEEDVKKAAMAYDADYAMQTDALQAKLQKYDQEAATQTDSENQKRALEVEEMKRKLELFAQGAQQELQKKQFDLYRPIEEKAQNAIKDVAAERGIIYVFDSSPGKGLIVFDKGENIFEAVKAKLGI
ncbi:MAG: hypothetical protein COB12_12820 [Flavobacterium sp.]|nr:MAG: hypothetical protein COB12_12820 [Flavobacterium sp.]